MGPVEPYPHPSVQTLCNCNPDCPPAPATSYTPGPPTPTTSRSPKSQKRPDGPRDAADCPTTPGAGKFPQSLPPQWAKSRNSRAYRVCASPTAPGRSPKSPDGINRAIEILLRHGVVHHHIPILLPKSPILLTQNSQNHSFRLYLPKRLGKRTIGKFQSPLSRHYGSHAAAIERVQMQIGA